MGDITQALRTAQSGLLVNQQALNTVSNNIANVNTIGYSKKIVNFENVSIAGVPAGVRISNVTRSVDEGLLKTVRIENGELNALTGKETTFDRLQDLFGAPGDNDSLSHIIESFGEAGELLAANPGKTLEPTEFIRRAEDVVQKLQNMSNSIQEYRLQADQSITDIVGQINIVTAQIDQLNDDIISNGAVNRDVTDLRDLRDLELDKLSKLVDIRYFFRADGDVVVFTSGGQTLVDTIPPVLSHTSASALTPTSTHAEGDIEGIYVGTQIAANDITNDIREGQLKALIEVRDEILPNLQAQIDHLSAAMRDAFNEVHNRGVPFPGATSMTGTREIIAGGTQTITLDAAGSVDDVAIVLVDSNGDQTATTTLNSIMTVATFGGTAQASRGPWTVDEVATHLQGYLQANVSSASTATVNSSGKLQIDLNSTSFNLAFRDQTATAVGSDAEDAAIGFDSNGDGNIDETISGFSSFFGLNDFFVTNLSQNTYESDTLDSGFSTTAATFTFHDATSLGLGVPLGGSTLTVPAGTSLNDLATLITANVTDITASVVPDGAGSRLRVSHDNGTAFTFTQANSDTLIADMGIQVADTRVSSTISVRSDISNSPAKLSTGRPQFDSNLGSGGEYFTSNDDDTVARQLADTFIAATSFSQAGGLPSIGNTFVAYATDILANNAGLIAANERAIATEEALVNSLQFKSDSVRGVNLDEEMANLIVFEQAFSAAARVISVIKEMMEALERII